MGGRAAAILAGGGGKSRAASILGTSEDEPDLEPPAPDMDFSSEAMEVPRDYSPKGILDQLLHGNAQRDQEKRESALAAQGIDYERPSVASTYMGAMSPFGSGPAIQVGATGAKALLGSLMRGGTSMANETVMGAATAALEEIQNGASPEELIESVMQSGAASGAIDAGLQGVGAVGRGVGKLGSFLGGKARNVVAGGTKKEAEAILEHYDQPEAIDERLGGLLEQYSPSPWYGRSSGGYLKDIKRQLGDEGIHYDDVMDRAVEEGVNDALPQAWSNVQGRATDDALAAMERPIGKPGRQRASEMAAVADDVNALPQPQDVRAFGYEKSLVQSDAAPDNIISRSIGDSAADAAVGNLGRIYRDELEGVMSTATPRTHEDFVGSRDAYRDMSTLRDLLKAKTAAEQSGGDFGNAISGAILGGGVGMAGSAVTPGDDSSMLGLGGAAAGLATGTRSALRQAAGSWGADVGANILKGGGRAVQRTSNFLDNARVGGLTGQAVADNNDRTRGHEAVKTVEQALASNPQLLGPFAERLAQAENKQVEVTVLWDEEPEFRQLMRRLQGGR